MRLIDADALRYRRKDYGGYDDVSDEERTEGIMFLLKEDIDNAPTIYEYDAVQEYCRKRGLVVMTLDLFEKITREYGDNTWIKKI